MLSTHHFFDPSVEAVIRFGGSLPHWSQPGVVVFITWRTWDSIPEHVLNEWIQIKNRWLDRHGLDRNSQDVPRQLGQLSPELQRSYRQLVSDRWEAKLDSCHGTCVLRLVQCAEIVASSLKHFDHDRYRLHDFVIMPNHVHLLVTFENDQMFETQTTSWKKYTATQINRFLGRSGRFWMTESFDHLVRSDEQFRYLRDYIKDNPRRARVALPDVCHYSEATKPNCLVGVTLTP